MLNTKIRVENSLDRLLTLWFEPWAESLTIQPAQSVTVEIMSATDDPVDMQQHAEGIVFFSPANGTMKVSDNEGRTVWEAWESAPGIPS